MLTTALKKNVIKASSYLESFFENIFKGPTYSNVIKLLSCLALPGWQFYLSQCKIADLADLPKVKVS